MLLIDLDGFKSVNDSHGQAAGDHVLRVVAQRMQASMRPGDTVARLAGDEFLAILIDGRPRDAALSVTASIGVALAPELSSNLDRLILVNFRPLQRVVD